MQIVFYILTSLMAIGGVGILVSASQNSFRYLGLTLGGLTYLISAIIAFFLNSWWPLLIGFLLSLVIRKIFGDPSG